VLVEKTLSTLLRLLLGLMTGSRRPEQITRDVRKLVRPGVEVLLAEGQAVDLANRTVQTSTQTVPYDYLVVALGRNWPETIRLTLYTPRER
jgi:NADH dehydrogenase FAD-containing subunit